MEEVRLTVDVDCTSGVVAWKDGLELDDTILVAGLDSAQEGGVEVGCIGFVAVAARLDTGVGALTLG